jgi:hypothetical protein
VMFETPPAKRQKKPAAGSRRAINYLGRQLTST